MKRLEEDRVTSLFVSKANSRDGKVAIGELCRRLCHYTDERLGIVAHLQHASFNHWLPSDYAESILPSMVDLSTGASQQDCVLFVLQTTIAFEWDQGR